MSTLKTKSETPGNKSNIEPSSFSRSQLQYPCAIKYLSITSWEKQKKQCFQDSMHQKAREFRAKRGFRLAGFVLEC